MNSKILISDFDGTMTAQDFYTVALKRLPAEAAGYWALYEKGELSHFSALAAIFAMLTVDEAEYAGMLEEMGLEEGIESRVAELSCAGWGVEIASAGCSCYIERLLGSRGLSIPLHANPGIFSPAQGVVMGLPEGEEYFSPETGVDKKMIVSKLQGRGVDVAYAGDGRPDLAPALLLPPNRRFARGWLADELTRLKEPFTRFALWSEIATTLIGGPTC
jgi:2-hydroxy-3-keto-5-methylthiopentenyl-1-phosphate phosphatase